LAATVPETSPSQPLSGSPAVDFIGALPYIPPEQMTGDQRRITHLSDIYALGTILYELITLQPVFSRNENESTEAFAQRIFGLSIIPPHLRAPDRGIREELSEICMRCLARDPADRYQRAMDLHAAITTLLEGTRELEWRMRRAGQHLRTARNAVKRYNKLRTRIHRSQMTIERMSMQINRWDEPGEAKRALWHLEGRVDRLKDAAMVAFTDAERAYSQALADLPRMPQAMKGLTNLYWRRFIDAETSGDRGLMRYYEAKLREFDIHEEYAPSLSGRGSLEISTSPPGAEVILFRYEERDRILHPTAPSSLGRSPVKSSLEIGSYLLKIRYPGYRDVIYPIYMSRADHIAEHVRLYTDEAIGARLAYIPAGVFRVGGDPEAYCADTQVRWLPDYAIGRFPVTCGEYLEFLNDLARLDRSLAERHVPRDSNDRTPLWPWIGDRYILPQVEDRDGHRWTERLPIIHVSWDNAMAYARWLGKKENRPYRLPSADEWEKAARGSDGRTFPWGNRFEPTYCKNRDAHSGPPFPEVVGAYATDVSPYGVHDVAGGVGDWTMDVGGGNNEMRITMGGTWVREERGCRLARRILIRKDATVPSLGFRLCMSLGTASVSSSSFPP